MLKYVISFLSDTQVFAIMKILNDILHSPATYPTLNQQNIVPNLNPNLHLKTKSSPTNIPSLSPLSKTVLTPCQQLKQREMQLELSLNTVHRSDNSPFCTHSLIPGPVPISRPVPKINGVYSGPRPNPHQSFVEIC